MGGVTHLRAVSRLRLSVRGDRSQQAVAQINKFNNCHFEFLAVILNLFQNLLIAISYETLKQVQGDSLDVHGGNT